MSKTLSYRDAVRLLGGQDSKIVSALDKLAGGLLLGGAAAGVPGMLTLFGAKAEAVRLGQELVRKLSDRRSGVSRYSRTQRLEAAHAVLVVTAYFDALAETELPVWFTDLDLTKAERVAIADGDSPLGRDTARLINVVLSEQFGLPAPQLPYENYLAKLRDVVYTTFSGEFLMFAERLAVWDRLSESDHRGFQRALDGVICSMRCCRSPL